VPISTHKIMAHYCTGALTGPVALWIQELHSRAK